MAAILAEAAQKYSLVVVDSPPLLSAADATGIASLPDVSVLLVVGNAARRRLVRRALRKLELIEANVVGAVMNRDGRLSSYSY
jgi:Mrp family chromosome partitioning ATPase